MPLPGTYTFKTFFKAICNSRSILASGDIKAIVKVKYLEEIDSSNPATNKSKYGSSAIEPGIYQKEKEYVVSNTLGGTFDWNAYEKLVLLFQEERIFQMLLLMFIWFLVALDMLLMLMTCL